MLPLQASEYLCLNILLHVIQIYLIWSGYKRKEGDLNVILFHLASGDKEIRTLDPLLAKQVLYQLSYTPLYVGPGRVELPTSTLSV